MLVLKRKTGQTINVGDNISVTVRRIKRGRVTIAVDAPQSVRIRRSEIMRAELLEQAEALEPNPVADP